MRAPCFILFLLIVCSCDPKKVKEEGIGKRIKIDLPNMIDSGDHSDLFSASRFVPLETTPNSLIGEINRISIFEGVIYLLDKQTDTIFAFNINGKFIFKIHTIGKAGGEYLSINDFAIDEEKKELLIYCDRPYKLMHYNLNGKFINEQRFHELYRNIAFAKGKLLLMNYYPEAKYMFSVKPIDGDKMIDFHLFNDLDKKFSEIKMPVPNTIKGKSVLISLPYSSTIFEFTGDDVIPKYNLDFGARGIDEDVYKRSKDVLHDFQNAILNGKGTAIRNLKENDGYIYFSFGPNILCIYSKKTGKAISLTFLTSNPGYDFSGTFMAHDGNDRDLISIIYARDFKAVSASYKKKKPALWSNIPQRYKELDLNLEELDNPILEIFTLQK